MSDGAKLVQKYAATVQKLLSTSIFDHSKMMPPTKLSNAAAKQWFDQQKSAELLLMAGIGKSFFEKQHKIVKENCVDLGMWSDDHLSSILPGTPVTLFTGANVIITCKTKTARTRIDTKALIAELLKAGVKQDVLSKALAASEVTDAPAKSIEVTPL